MILIHLLIRLMRRATMLQISVVRLTAGSNVSGKAGKLARSTRVPESMSPIIRDKPSCHCRTRAAVSVFSQKLSRRSMNAPARHTEQSLGAQGGSSTGCNSRCEVRGAICMCDRAIAAMIEPDVTMTSKRAHSS